MAGIETEILIEREAKYDSYQTKKKIVTEKCEVPRNRETRRQIPPDDRQRSPDERHERRSRAKREAEILNEREAE